MAASTLVRLVHSGDRFTQRCIIPAKFFEIINVKIGDYVTLQTSEKVYVCQIHAMVKPVSCVYVDNTVTSLDFGPYQCRKLPRESLELPESITHFKVSRFDVVTVKVVFGNAGLFSCGKNAYESVVRNLLSHYVFGKKCVIKCNGLKTADLVHINCLVIAETFPEHHSYGRVNKSSKVEIIDILTLEQMYQINEFKNIKVGGINNAMNILKLNLLACKSNRVLVTGPSGSGKTLFAKKFCSSMKCFFVFIDGLRNTDLTSEKCNEIQKQFSTYLKIFPNKTCILFIDHINILAPYNLKTKSSVFLLINLINCLQNLNVSVFAAAGQRTDINSAVSALFTREVNLGIPSFIQRKEIVEVLIESLNCDINCDKIAQMTPGFVGHDISSLIKTAVTITKEKAKEESDLLHLTIEDFEKALVCISPSVLKTSVWSMKVKPVYWKDIGGMFSIKQKLQTCVELPLRNPGLFKKVDLPCPHGVLLFGPPGCCKTTLARGLATECNANFFAANPAQIYSSYVGDSEKNITELFYQARLCAPSIIFLDELDSLVSQRKLEKKSQGVGEKVLSCLLNEMDGFGTKVQFQNDLMMTKLLHNDESKKKENENIDIEQHSNDVIVVAATNRPDLIDDALLRPGRFDIILYVPPPNEEERESILHTLTEKMPVKSIDMKKIATRTELFSGADLKCLCNEAAMNALRHDMSASYIIEENFDEALRKIKPSITKQQIEMYEKLTSKYGTVVK